MDFYHLKREKEPDHSEQEALEKLYGIALERNKYLSEQCIHYLKLIKEIDEKCLGIVRDIRKEELNGDKYVEGITM